MSSETQRRRGRRLKVAIVPHPPGEHVSVCQPLVLRLNLAVGHPLQSALHILMSKIIVGRKGEPCRGVGDLSNTVGALVHNDSTPRILGAEPFSKVCCVPPGGKDCPRVFSSGPGGGNRHSLSVKQEGVVDSRTHFCSCNRLGNPSVYG